MNDAAPHDQSRIRDDRIDELCDRFERQLRAGEQPRIEDVLAASSGVDRACLLAELIAAEIEFRSGRGESPSAEEYMRRFPHDADTIGEFVAKRLETVRFVPGESTRIGDRFESVTHLAAQRPAGAGMSTPPTSESPGTGERFGDYELLGELARGGMGVVYKARQISLNRVVALKMIKTGSLAGEDEIRRFHSEAEAAAALDHPHIVPIFEVGQSRAAGDSAPVHFFSMGFVDGQSLADRLGDGPLPPRDAAGLVQTIAEAVQYAHDKGIVHRDLKPANVLLAVGQAFQPDPNGRVTSESQGASGQAGKPDLLPRITDFGLAKNITAGDSGMTATGQIMGTPGFMPPEQARGDVANIGPLADVYSLGAILYATLTGRPPFQAASVMETLKQVLEQQPVSPRQLNPAVDRDLETICLKCLEKELHKRYESAREFAQDITRYLEGRPIVARPIGRPAHLWRWCRRNPLLATVSGLALVLVLTLSTGGPLMAARQSALADRAESEAANAKAALAEVDSTVDRYFTKMSEEKLLDQPGMETLRKDLLTDAMAHYEGVVRRGAQDRETWKKVARAHYRLAFMTEKIGSMAGALDQHRKSLAIWQRLDHEDALPVDEMLTVGHNQTEIALTLEHAGSYDESMQWSRAALSTLETLRQRADTPEVRYELARANHNLAVTCWKFGRRQEGHDARRRARDLIGGLVREFPSSYGYRNLQASAAHSLSIQHYESNKLADAIRWNTDALALRVKLVQERPQRPEAHFLLARVQMFRGQLEANGANLKSALASYEKAAANLSRLADRHPLVTEYRQELAIAYSNLAAAQMKVHDRNSAKQSFERALHTSEELVKVHADVVRFRRSRGVARTGLGQFATDAGLKRKLFAGAVDDLRRPVQRHPQSATDRLAYAVALQHQGSLLLDGGQIGKAVSALNEAWKQLNAAKSLEPTNPDIREVRYNLFLRRFTALKRQRNAAELGAMAAEFRPMVKGDGVRLLFVAGAFATAAEIGSRAKQTPLRKVDGPQQRWAGLAVKTLAEANAALNQSAAFWTGYFNGNPDWNYFRRNPDGVRQMNVFLKSLKPVKGDVAIRGRIAFYSLVRDVSLSLPDDEKLKVGAWKLALYAGMDYLAVGNATAASQWLKTALDTAASIDRDKLRAQGEEFPLDNLAETHYWLGVATFRKHGEKGYFLAEADFRKAVAIWTEMRTIDLRKEFQSALRLLAAARRELGKSITHESEAGLAESLAYLGSATRRRGRIDEARDYYKRSVALYRRLAAAHPDKPHYATNGINSLGNLGRLEIQNNRLAEAAKWYAQGVQELQKLQQAGKADGRTRGLLQDFQRNLKLIQKAIQTAAKKS